MADQLVVFALGDNRYALGISEVQEILRVSEITPVPEMPAHVEGVINLRGAVVPVLNLRLRLGLEKIPMDQHTRIILVESEGNLFGLIVDRVLEVNTYTAEEFEHPDTVGLTEGMLAGIVKKDETMWLILDLKKIA